MSKHCEWFYMSPTSQFSVFRVESVRNFVGMHQINICRICLKGNVSLISIFSENSEFYNQITNLASVQVSPEDELPQEICDSCVSDLKYSFEFKVKIEQSDIELRKKQQNKISENEYIIDYNNLETSLEENDDEVCEIVVDNHKQFKSKTKMNPKVQSALQALLSTAPQNKKPTECHLCNKNFSCRGQLTRHFKTHIGIKNYSCNICGKSYMESGHLRKHYLYKHTDTEKPHKCETCRRTFEVRSALIRHIRTHTGERPYFCSICQKNFISVNDLTKHKKIHSERERPFVCEVCSKGFIAKQTLKFHLLGHYGSKNFICAHCNKPFLTKNTLKNHIFLTHFNIRNFMCQVCAKVYKTKNCLDRHIRTHTGEIIVTTHQCPLCERKLFSSSNLNYHIKSVHKQERNYSCEFCLKAFLKPQILKIHRRYHTGERPYPCSFCEKCFHTGETRKVHERIHTGERPYVCNLCGSAFSQGGTLKTHMKSHG